MNPMTQKQRMNYIASKKERYASASDVYREGYNAYKGGDALEEIKSNPYKGAGRGDWHEGVCDAYYVGIVQKEIDTLVPVTFDQVLKLPRTPSKDGWVINSMVNDSMLPDMENLYGGEEDSKFYDILVEEIYSKNHDGERTEDIGLLSFKGEPTMLYNASGRGGYEYSNVFILDADRYRSMLNHIRSVLEEDEETNRHVVNGDDDAELLINFYGSRKDHLFNK